MKVGEALGASGVSVCAVDADKHKALGSAPQVEAPLQERQVEAPLRQGKGLSGSALVLR